MYMAMFMPLGKQKRIGENHDDQRRPLRERERFPKDECRQKKPKQG